MKSRTSLFGLLAAATMFVACNNTNNAPADNVAATEPAQETASSNAPAKMETASFQIEGMSCAIGCAKTIESKVAGMNGVQEAIVDFDTKTATVKFDASKQTPEKIVETVEAVAGGKTYKVSNVKSSGDQAMAFGDPKKEKKKKKAKKGETSETKPCAPGAANGEKPACCAAKKSCHTEAKTL